MSDNKSNNEAPKGSLEYPTGTGGTGLSGHSSQIFSEGSIMVSNNYGVVNIIKNSDDYSHQALIQSIRERIIKLIPFEDIVTNLQYLRGLSGERQTKEKIILNLFGADSIKFRKKKSSFAEVSYSFSGFTFSVPISEKFFEDDSIESDSKKIFNDLKLAIFENNKINSKIESFKESKENQPPPEVLSNIDIVSTLSVINDRVNICTNSLGAKFSQTIYSMINYTSLIENIISKIGHKEFKDEGIMHSKVVADLERRLSDSQEIIKSEFDVLSGKAIGTLGILTELEMRRLVVERLVFLDRKRQNWTKFLVILFMLLFMLSIAGLIYFNVIKEYLPQGKTFIAVILWSVIGSFASMIYRFNKIPVYDFGDTLKWLLTRPVQGLTLGAALYLVLISGQYFFTGQTGDISKNQEIVLFISFLLGFSDRFTENVFNALIDKYSYKQSNTKEKDAPGNLEK
ncbi:MAG: hypothetical protein JNL02_04150 [Saprospiraceae bacterium]|nr:hypothetical protein [Saprospiraceae bacterium]